VIGRNTFLGAGNTFTDFNLLDRPILANGIHGLGETGQVVLGGCVGHNCRIGSGHVFFPARSVESDVVMFARQDRTVVTKNVMYEDSDHHAYPGAGHIPMYHQDDEVLPPEEEEQGTKTTEELLKSA
jgi:hypothetical protein